MAAWLLMEAEESALKKTEAIGLSIVWVVALVFSFSGVLVFGEVSLLQFSRFYASIRQIIIFWRQKSEFLNSNFNKVCWNYVAGRDKIHSKYQKWAMIMRKTMLMDMSIQNSCSQLSMETNSHNWPRQYQKWAMIMCKEMLMGTRVMKFTGQTFEGNNHYCLFCLTRNTKNWRPLSKETSLRLTTHLAATQLIDLTSGSQWSNQTKYFNSSKKKKQTIIIETSRSEDHRSTTSTAWEIFVQMANRVKLL